MIRQLQAEREVRHGIAFVACVDEQRALAHVAEPDLEHSLASRRRNEMGCELKLGRGNAFEHHGLLRCNGRRRRLTTAYKKQKEERNCLHTVHGVMTLRVSQMFQNGARR